MTLDTITNNRIQLHPKTRALLFVFDSWMYSLIKVMDQEEISPAEVQTIQAQDITKNYGILLIATNFIAYPMGRKPWQRCV